MTSWTGVVPGATLAVVAPSDADAAAFPRRLQRGVAFMEREGFLVRVHPTVLDRTTDGIDGAPRRARALEEVLLDPDVDAVVTTIGGTRALATIAAVDFPALAGVRTPLIGYSDTGAIQLALLAELGLASVFGPAVLPQLGEFGGCAGPAWSSLLDVLAGRPGDDGSAPAVQVSERLMWEDNDDRPRRLVARPPARAVSDGEASGRWIIANLDVLVALSGTRFLPSLDGALLVIEVADGVPERQVVRQLDHLRIAGLLHQPAAIGFGTDVAHTPVYREFARHAGVTDRVPVVTDLPFGHVDPSLSWPIGLPGWISAAGDSVRYGWRCSP